MARPPLLRAALPILLVAAPALSRQTPTSDTEETKPGIPVAQLSYVNKMVERSEGKTWKRIEEGSRVKTGDRLRTGPDAIARIEFPWTFLTVGPGSVAAIPPSVVLSTALERGRIELRAESGEILKLRTAEAVVRGKGRVVVRREGQVTSVMALDGSFRIEVADKTLALAEGEGAIVRPGQMPSAPVKLSRPLGGLLPGADPLYVAVGKPVKVDWRSEASLHHIEVRPLHDDKPWLAYEVGPPPFTLEIPWVGTFRWRVSTRDGGLESLPSADGWICVLDKDLAP